MTEPAADTAARAAAGSGTGHGRLHRLKRSGLLLFMVIALSVVLVGLQGYVVARSLADYRRAHEDSTVWMAASLDNDILRFEVALLQSLRPAGNAAQPVEAAVRAFDLYYSRLAVVSAMMTRIGPQMADPDGAAAQVASLRADAELIAARIDAGRFAEAAVREQLLVRLQQSDDVAHDLANDLLNFAVDLTERRRRISEERLTWLIALTLALTIKLVAVAWYYRWLSRHERERSSALDLLQNTARMSPEAILMTDANGRILWINPAAESLIGLEAEGVIGTPLTRYLAPPQVGASTLSGGFEAWAALGRVSGLLLPVRGRRLPVDVVTVANRGAAGERLFVFFLRDLSDALAQRTAAHKARRNGPPASLAPQPAAQRILVVDDSRPAAEMVAQTLRLMGHAVQEAASGEEAVALATLCPFDTVFLDIQMPGMDGLEAAAHIRAGGQSSRARLVALSASLSPADVPRAHAQGIDLVLTKPATPEALAAALRGEGLPVRAPSQPAADTDTLQFLRQRLGDASLSRLSLGLIAEIGEIETAERLDHPAPEIRALVHRTAGTSAIMGFSALHAACRTYDLALASPEDTVSLRRARDEWHHAAAGVRRLLSDVH